jgi:2-polyprenyl-6-methoxyphenol hydroxylase-like FAD-dependent oxidoreductase
MTRYLVIGGGIVGLATARALHQMQPGARITMHGHVHAGPAAVPALAREGYRRRTLLTG